MLSEFLCFMVNYPPKQLLTAQSFGKFLKRPCGTLIQN